MSERALKYLRSRTREKDGMAVVPFLACREAARESGIAQRVAEALALENGICYVRNIGTFGMAGQAKLLRSHAAVAGCGGLGGWIIEILARAGVGELTVFDGDVFDDGNLNRQLLAEEFLLGQPKAEAAVRRARAINGAIAVNAYCLRLNGENATELLRGCGVVIDALDGNSSRRDVFLCCRGLGLPFVHGAIGGTFGQVGVFYPEDSPPWLDVDFPDWGVEAEAGSPSFTPPLVASLQCAEAVKLLAGLEGGLRGALLWFDMGGNDMQKIRMGGEK